MDTTITINRETNEIEIYDDFYYGKFKTETGYISDDDLDLLWDCNEYGKEESEEIETIIDNIIEFEKNVLIRGVLYEWEDIEHIFNVEESLL